MKKSNAIALANSKTGLNELNHRNTTFAQVSSNRPAWWMNIKLERFQEEINILLVDKPDLIWLQIPANTFTDLSSDFRVWESKNAVDVYISCDQSDRYFMDVASGASGVDFKPFIKKRFPIPTQFLNLPEEKKESNSEKEKKSLVQKVKPHQRIIQENQSNISYEKLFAEYLKGAQKIVVQDPYIRYRHQFKNLVEFGHMLGEIKEDSHDLELEVKTWNIEEFKETSIDNFELLKKSLAETGVKLSFSFENIHDRFITTDTGWKIVLGRGLDIFNKEESEYSLGNIDQSKRKCRPCEITYFRNN